MATSHNASYVLCTACAGTGHIENHLGEDCVCAKCDGWGDLRHMPDNKTPSTMNDEQHP